MAESDKYRSIFHAPDEFTRGRAKDGIPVQGVPVVFDGISDDGSYGWFLGRLQIFHGKYLHKAPEWFFRGEAGKQAALARLKTAKISPEGVLE